MCTASNAPPYNSSLRGIEMRAQDRPPRKAKRGRPGSILVVEPNACEDQLNFLGRRRDDEQITCGWERTMRLLMQPRLLWDIN